MNFRLQASEQTRVAKFRLVHWLPINSIAMSLDTSSPTGFALRDRVPSFILNHVHTYVARIEQLKQHATKSEGSRTPGDECLRANLNGTDSRSDRRFRCRIDRCRRPRRLAMLLLHFSCFSFFLQSLFLSRPNSFSHNPCQNISRCRYSAGHLDRALEKSSIDRPSAYTLHLV